MYWQTTIHILICDTDTQDEACDVVSNLFSQVPFSVADWAYPQDSTGHVLLPIPRPDLRRMGYEAGEFLNALNELQHPCPYCPEPMILVDTSHDQAGYSRATWWCPNCEAWQVIKNIPPEEDFNGS